MHGGNSAFEIWEKLIQFQTLQWSLYVILGEKQNHHHPFLPIPPLPILLPTSLRQEIPVQAYSVHPHFGPCFSEGP